MSQEYMAHGSLGLFTQAPFNEQSQDDSSQNHYGGGNARPLQTQSLLNPLYSQPFTHYHAQQPNMQTSQQQHSSQPGQASQNKKIH